MARLRTHRRALAAGVAAVLVLVALAVGLAEGGSDTTAPDDVPSLAEARARVADAPAPLARLYAPRPDSAASGGVPILDLDRAGVRRLLAGLRGRPVLVNVWYPDCAPCRREFPVLRTAAAAYGTRLAMLGLATQGSRADVAAFLRGQPTLYPHVLDPGAGISRGELQAGNAYPSSVLIDARGRIAFVQAGEFPSLADLERALEERLGLRPPPASTDAGTTASRATAVRPAPARGPSAAGTPIPTSEGAAR